MRLLHVTHPSGFNHDTGSLHPERPARLRAAEAGVVNSGLEVESVTAQPLTADDLAVAHDPDYVEAIRRFCASGGGHLDPDTLASEGSWEAALAAAGAGPTAVTRLSDGFDGPAFISVRPPGHHAMSNRAMGFCLFNNIAITASRLRDRGERVAILDWDVHHGNGTQRIFYEEPDVLYVSLHQGNFYPFEGEVDEIGHGPGRGSTVNIPLPAFTAGEVYLRAFEEIAMPVIRGFAPDWILVSSGFDAHAHDPLAELRLVEADYAHMARALTTILDPRRLVAFLEGGYHLPAIRDSVTAVVRSLAGEEVDAEPSPFESPPGSLEALLRIRAALTGRVVGLA